MLSIRIKFPNFISKNKKFSMASNLFLIDTTGDDMEASIATSSVSK
jgi:hypothetical protein